MKKTFLLSATTLLSFFLSERLSAYTKESYVTIVDNSHGVARDWFYGGPIGNTCEQDKIIPNQYHCMPNESSHIQFAYDDYHFNYDVSINYMPIKPLKDSEYLSVLKRKNPEYTIPGKDIDHYFDTLYRNEVTDSNCNSFQTDDGLIQLINIGKYGNTCVDYLYINRQPLRDNIIIFNPTGLATDISIEQTPQLEMLSIDSDAEFSEDVKVQKNSLNIVSNRFPSLSVTKVLEEVQHLDSDYIFKAPDPRIPKGGIFLAKLSPMKIKLSNANKEYNFELPSLYLGVYNSGIYNNYKDHYRWMIGVDKNNQGGNGHFVVNKDHYLEFLADDKLSCIVFKPHDKDNYDIDMNTYDLELRNHDC